MMAKRLFLLLVLSIIGVISAPDFLMADNFSVKSPGQTAVLTVEPEPIVEYVQITPSPAIAAQPVYVAPPVMNYSVSFYIGSVSEFNATAYSLSYSGLYKFSKMIYGHNSYNLLGNLSSRYVGETITITEGGVSKSYVVMSTQTYQKTADGFLNGDASLMGRIATTALGYDVALFTCAGESYGNGDASHRLVVFANAI